MDDVAGMYKSTLPTQFGHDLSLLMIQAADMRTSPLAGKVSDSVALSKIPRVDLWGAIGDPT